MSKIVDSRIKARNLWIEKQNSWIELLNLWITVENFWIQLPKTIRKADFLNESAFFNVNHKTNSIKLK
ncbi:hypothetical protein ABE65_010215 [Fictibacillus phosphorivorans]|uniref:Transposase n=1 Tax=Fictibacillus phosphorivorans TaxID=1221500 RepID=A0A160ILR1_9BACL|nr:hypothetical protein ABE65_010215 [Fictibacillus phosphorivorans]